ncbi:MULTISPECIES: cysteine hydrolase family protein [Sutcliffiella]|uniref:Isochorismatase n=1 Tax=Sutcliffiella cohnii TaxID=33932 RepID=A0A223KWV9_9BACI|nr:MULTISPECIES: isochorismatase family cysteine hydrolase [Sutcliffiella]AST93950.1 isochorismatase [Sutcliffiella cohnii]MED4018450.1 cysteine hydrolase [Sutcliffiella cohnii]WBL15153.1 cysteine hydrolase [Sutcliffiella sp. NC1]
MSHALLIIDIINDFQFGHGAVLAEKTQAFVPDLLALKKKLKKLKIPIIYVNDHYGIWQADYNKIIEKCSNIRSKHIIDILEPEQDDFFLIKPKHSAFYETALHTLLTELKIDSLILTGLAGNICVLFTANDAYMRGYKLYALKDCIASNNNHDNLHALTMMKNVMKATIVTSTDIVNLLDIRD